VPVTDAGRVVNGRETKKGPSRRRALSVSGAPVALQKCDKNRKLLDVSQDCGYYPAINRVRTALRPAIFHPSPCIQKSFQMTPGGAMISGLWPGK